MKAPTKASRRNLPAAARVLIANARNDITIPRFTTTLRPLDETLLAKGGARGLALYDEIERDTHAYAVLSKRKHQLVSREWTIEPGGDTAADAAAAALAEEVLGSLPFDRLSLDLLDATLKGYAVAEIVWMRDGARIVPERIVAHDPRRFVFDLDWQPRLITTEAMTDGIPLPARNFIVHRFGVRGNNPYGLGLGSKLFWAVLFKREGVAFWLHFLERFAAPTPVGKHPLGMLPQDQTKLLESLGNLAQGLAILVPIGTEVELLEAKRAGEAGYEAWCRYWDEQISECVLGETLTTNIGDVGSKAASETHAGVLDQLVDADGDLLGDTLRSSLLTWLTDYNHPGAAVPWVSRPRPTNEGEIADARAKRAAADTAELEAAAAAAAFLDRLQAPEPMLRLMEAARTGADGIVVELLRAALAGGRAGQRILREPETPPAESDGDRGDADDEDEPAPSFAERLFGPAEPCPVCLAEGGEDVVARLTAAVAAAVAPAIGAWTSVLSVAIGDADALAAVPPALLEAVARLDDRAFARALGDSLVLAELVGRAEVVDDDGAAALAEITWNDQPFAEAVAFLQQKVALPSRSYTDLMHQAHDRAFVVAGATSVALVEDLKAAVVRVERDGLTLADFRRDFEAIVERHGWTGWTGEDTAAGRAWRTRTILETNLRTAHQAGRLKQMRAVAGRRPWWQYRHGVLRRPKTPREDHVALHGLVWRHDDPVWQQIYPPNDWGCTCGVRTLSDRDLDRLGLTPAEPLTEGAIEEVAAPEWRYAPGDTWERGVVPPALQKPLPPAEQAGPKVFVTDPPLPSIARPLRAGRLADGLQGDAAIAAFLAEFGAAAGTGVLWRDKAGQALVISDQLFAAGRGGVKAAKFGSGSEMLRLAEALQDPDEIWVDWAWDEMSGRNRLVRRYLRFDPNGGGLTVFEWSPVGWSAVTTFPSKAGQSAAAQSDTLNQQRTGALLWRRPD